MCMTLGENIRARRKELGISVDDLAEKVGKNRATIYRYENDEIEMPVNLLRPIAEALDTVPDLLMDWDFFLREVAEGDSQMCKVLPLLENGVSIKATDRSYIILKAPVHNGFSQYDLCPLLSALYRLYVAGCDEEIRSLRIITEIASTLDQKSLEHLMSYAEFLDSKQQEKVGESYLHPYRQEDAAVKTQFTE